MRSYHVNENHIRLMVSEIPYYKHRSCYFIIALRIQQPDCLGNFLFVEWGAFLTGNFSKQGGSNLPKKFCKPSHGLWKAHSKKGPYQVIY